MNVKFVMLSPIRISSVGWVFYLFSLYPSSWSGHILDSFGYLSFLYSTWIPSITHSHFQLTWSSFFCMFHSWFTFFSFIVVLLLSFFASSSSFFFNLLFLLLLPSLSSACLSLPSLPPVHPSPLLLPPPPSPFHHHRRRHYHNHHRLLIASFFDSQALFFLPS